MKKINPRGFTLIEVLVALGLFMASVICYFSLTLFYQRSRTDAVSAQTAKEILLLNILEIRGNRLVDLPPQNKCITRHYDVYKELKSSETLNRSGSCPRPTPRSGEVVVVWEVVGATELNEELEDELSSVGLKLPRYGDSIRQFKLVALQNGTNGSKDVKDTSLSIYKRQ